MIRKIIKEDDYRHRHHYDVVRLQTVMRLNGYEADLRSAAGIWEEISDTFAAGWMGLPKDDEDLWEAIRVQVEAQSKL